MKKKQKRNSLTPKQKIFIMIILTVFILAIAIMASPYLSSFVLFALGISISIPISFILLIWFSAQKKDIEKEHIAQLKVKDSEIKKLNTTIQDYEHNIQYAKEIKEKNKCLERDNRIIKDKYNYVLKYREHFKTLYVRNTYPQKVYVFCEFVYSNFCALGLFDPIRYLSERKYSTYINTNVDAWNSYILEAQKHNNPQYAINKIYEEQAKSKPPKSESDSSSVSEQESDRQSDKHDRQPKKKINFINNEEER